MTDPTRVFRCEIPMHGDFPLYGLAGQLHQIANEMEYEGITSGTVLTALGEPGHWAVGTPVPAPVADLHARVYDPCTGFLLDGDDLAAVLVAWFAAHGVKET
jgi:hypothetical protein